jgi:hypothetical protein
MKKTATEPFIMLPRSLIQSDAWRSAGINTRRFVDFLLLEHMAHGGKANGKLKAPRRQLWDFGIGVRHVTPAIDEAEELGLVDCHRGGMRVSTTYTVTWLPLCDGTAASNRWRDYQCCPPEAENVTELPNESYNSGIRRDTSLVSEGISDGPNLVSEGISD